MGNWRWKLGAKYVPTSPYQVREEERYLYPTMEWGTQAGSLASQFPQDDRQRATEKAGALAFFPLTLPLSHSAVPSPAHLTHQSCPQPHPASFARFKLNHHYQLTTSVAQRTASVSAWDSLPTRPLPNPPSFQRARGVLVPAAASQPSPRYPQRPRASCSAPYPVTPPPFRVPVAFPPPNDDDGLGL